MSMEAIFPIIMLFMITAAGIAVILQTNHDNVNNLIFGFGTWLFQVLLMIGLYLSVRGNIASQMIQVILVVSAALVLLTGIILEVRSKA